MNQIRREALADRLITLAQGQGRIIVAIAGAPGSGKSTLAEALAKAIGPDACVVPMDGFHLDNTVLKERGLFARKGAPETFDAEGFRHLITRLSAGGDVIYPTFDRELDLARAGAGVAPAQAKIVLCEGNYLLLDRPIWADLAQHWDATVFLDVPMEELERRLIQRWLDHGHSPEQAKARAMGNDIPNARQVVEHSRRADFVVT
ncbi:nucleoside triphosphate hydrolase [Actibacterium lipolyticum]|uniref:Pantothenate kinase n=1 Tax=Actibacterium lipolyticum TaxID=1524263 RepID=A0A238KUJ6_9RHOB|nr:nucleoside triphosphate hydrolase [Actibacterium lipolyticum]SMX46544.1 Pantothenate kinase [Actibacterium lipolyticum]